MSRFRTETAKGLAALQRARSSIIAIALTHAVTVIAGIVMVHTGNRFALSYRDRLVAQAYASDPVSRPFGKGITSAPRGSRPREPNGHVWPPA